ncbi:glycosyltransferase family 2 protein [SAR86 cluster bacterium]|nr:glycosyltransferase family 2 protein [SAR86 cluster bacterium]
MNIVFLLAGSSQSFYEEGYKYPKPMIEINGEMIISKVINNIKPIFSRANKIIFMILEEDDNKFHITNIIKLLVPDAKVIKVKNETSGAACTALLAIEDISNKEQLLITSGDHLIDHDLEKVIDYFSDSNCDGGTITFNSIHPRFSYVKISNNNKILETSEKIPISNNATAGFYFYSHGEDFVENAKKMILKGSEVNGNYYVCPVFNEMILSGKEITSYEINSENYHSLMSVELLENYKNSME